MSIAANRVAGDDSVSSLLYRVRRWELWSVPRAGMAFVLTVDLIAVAAAVVSIDHNALTRVNLTRALLLAGLAIAYSEGARRIERMRDYLHLAGPDRIGTTPTSVWAFPAALILPAGYAALVIAAIHGHMLLLGYRQKSVRPHRVVFGGAAEVLGAYAVAAVHHGYGASMLQGGPVVAATAGAALLAYTGVGLVVVVLGVRLLTDASSWRGLLPARSDLAFEAATLVLGWLAAEAVIRMPWGTPAIYVLIVMLHRSTLVSELENAAKTDVKTGLLNYRGWQELAGQHLLQATRMNEPAAVVVLDLDHFKNVNDTHGHPAGDAVLAAVADSLRHELRAYDAIGRYGGEEFLAYLNNVDATTAITVADRLRSAVSELNTSDTITVTASFGVATYPAHGTTLDALVHAADKALYTAKQAGRDRVMCAEAQ